VAAKIKPEDSEKFQILSQQFLLGIKRAILYQKVQALSITDGLTGVFSRRYCLERFREEVERSKKFKHNFSFLMIDVDYFKNYNDKYGHLVGDAILREVAATIKENIRQIDLLGRYGGEEFILVLTETGSEQSKFVAERIRKAVEEKQIKVYDENLGITISIGVATFPKDAEVPQAIIEKADQALYCAKEAGRNRVCLYPAKAA
jgi:diguanylate cyclase (GGDEF)-like protein